MNFKRKITPALALCAALGAGIYAADQISGGETADAVSVSKPLTNPKGYVALTYDDGPSEYTPTLLNTLAGNQVRATFFVQGNQAQQRKATVMKIHGAGHDIGWHSWDHPWMNKLSGDEFDRQVDDTLNLLRGWGVPVKVARPPYGELDQGWPYRTRGPHYQAIEARNVFVAIWDEQTNAHEETLGNGPQASQKLCARVVGGAKPGSVVLMHETLPSTVDAAQCVITGLRKKGLEPGRIVEAEKFQPLNNSHAIAARWQS